MRNTWMWIVIVVLIIAGGFVWWQGSQGAAVPTPTTDVTVPVGEPTTPVTNDASTTPVVTAPMNVTVEYTDAGFAPSPVTVAKGGTVTFVNKTSDKMWVATGPHPAHTGYDGDSTDRAEHCAAGYTGPTPFDQCAAGASYTFKFDVVGEWPFHNHSKSSDFGKIIVQ